MLVDQMTNRPARKVQASALYAATAGLAVIALNRGWGFDLPPETADHLEILLDGLVLMVSGVATGAGSFVGGYVHRERRD